MMTKIGDKMKRPPASARGKVATIQQMEGLMSQLSRSHQPRTLERAQQLIWNAWELADRKKRIVLAKAALKISPLCADAYVMLAHDEAKTPAEALSLYKQGIEAGEKALGKAAFVEDVGHFWGLLETRPYMRARHGLAMALWEAGHGDEAVGHYNELLRLNPGDNQGIRYLLIDCLLALGYDDKAAALLKQYDEDSCAWAWSRTLLSFRLSGDGPKARKALTKAADANKYVEAPLLGRTKMPRQLPALISMGGKDEAVSYVSTALQAWTAAPGALPWLSSASGGKRTTRAGEGKGRKAASAVR